MFHKLRKNLFFLKETTSGTWMTGTSVFVAANAKLPVRNIKIKVGNKEIERMIERNSIDSIKSLFYGEEVEITFDTDFYGSGTAGTVIGTVDTGFDLLMKSAGMSSVVSAGVSVTYALNVSAQTRISCGLEYISEDGASSFRFGFKGAAAAPKVELVAGGQAVYHWTLKGPVAYEGAVPQIGIAGTPVASIVRDTMDGRIPQFKGIAFAVGGVNRLISKLTLDYGITLEYQTDTTDPTTYTRCVYAGRKPTLTIDPEMTPKATADDFGKFFAGTTETCSIVLGTVAGQIATWTIPALQRTKNDAGERGVITTVETTFGCRSNSDAGEDSILLTLT